MILFNFYEYGKYMIANHSKSCYKHYQSALISLISVICVLFVLSAIVAALVESKACLV